MWAIPLVPGVSAGPGAPNRVSEADELREYARSPGKLTELAETDCMAGQRGLELRNVVAKYPFERFAQISRDPAEFWPQRLSDGGRRSSGPVPRSRQDACADCPGGAWSQYRARAAFA